LFLSQPLRLGSVLHLTQELIVTRSTYSTTAIEIHHCRFIKIREGVQQGVAFFASVPKVISLGEAPNPGLEAEDVGCGEPQAGKIDLTQVNRAL
jgi:hypothetical protein